MTLSPMMRMNQDIANLTGRPFIAEEKAHLELMVAFNRCGAAAARELQIRDEEEAAEAEADKLADAREAYELDRWDADNGR